MPDPTPEPLKCPICGSTTDEKMTRGTAAKALCRDAAGCLTRRQRGAKGAPA